MRQSQLNDVVEILGRRAVGVNVRNGSDLADAVAQGLSTAAFRNAVRALDQPEATIIEGLGLSRSTLHRRQAGGRLAPVESERAVRLARVASLGKVALGSMAAAGRWLLKPNRALGGRVPLMLLQSDVGTQEVEAVLGRAVYGGYS